VLQLALMQNGLHRVGLDQAIVKKLWTKKKRVGVGLEIERTAQVVVEGPDGDGGHPAVLWEACQLALHSPGILMRMWSFWKPSKMRV